MDTLAAPWHIYSHQKNWIRKPFESNSILDITVSFFYCFELWFTIYRHSHEKTLNTLQHFIAGLTKFVCWSSYARVFNQQFRPRISWHICVLLAWKRWDIVPHRSGRKTNCQCWKVYHQRKPYCCDDESFHAFLREEIVAFRIYLHNLLISWEISRFRISHQQQ